MKKTFEQTLKELFPKEGGLLHEAALYSMQGGKRLRPLLALAVLDTFDVSIERGLYPAAALEMIHTYSLIHDDLPCMDDDDERRGRPTLHKVYPESHAVLTGDFLLTYAFEILTCAPQLTESEKISLSRTLSQRAGSQGMLGGQLLDLEKSEQWEEMYLKKTGTLICAALEFGAILVGEALEPFQEIGKSLGMAFQLIDDIIDGDGAVKLFGVEVVEKKANQILENTKRKIGLLPGGAPKLQLLANEMIYRTV